MQDTTKTTRTATVTNSLRGTVFTLRTLLSGSSAAGPLQWDQAVLKNVGTGALQVACMPSGSAAPVAGDLETVVSGEEKFLGRIDADSTWIKVTAVDGNDIPTLPSSFTFTGTPV